MIQRKLKAGGHSYGEWSRQWRATPNKIKSRPILAYDTETIGGKIFLIACSDGKYKSVNSIEDALNFLSRWKSRTHLNLFWNIDYDANALFTYLDKDRLEEVYYCGETEIGKYKILYIPRKKLSIREKTRSTVYYDVMQFYHSSLNNASRKYLKKEKKDIDISRFEDKDWIRENWNDIVNYCVHDAELTAELGEILQRNLNKMGISFERPYSHASISMRYASTKYPLPKFYPKKRQEYALRSYYGGRFECFKRGYFPDVYQYDINSAYPSELSKLPDISLGKWVKKNTIDTNTEIGFLKCKVDIKENYAEPLPSKLNGLVIFPNFHSDNWFITLDEYNFLMDHNLADIEVKNGWFWEPDIIQYPFDWLRDLYQLRRGEKEKDTMMNLVLKLVMNSIYGKFIERIPDMKEVDDWNKADWVESGGEKGYKLFKRIKRTGNYYCPIWATLITSRVRLKLLKEMMERERELIAVFTDSMFLTKKSVDTSSELGEWSYEGEGELVIIASGLYTFKGDNRIKTALRGIRQTKREDLFKLLRKNKNKTSLKFIRKKVITLGEILTHTKLWRKKDFNRFKNIEKEIRLNSDVKRDWLGEFRKCGDLIKENINSKPLKI